MLEKFKRSLAASDIVKRGEYDYFVNPFTAGVPEVDPEIMQEICTSIKSAVDIKNVDVILTIEAMGIHVAAILSNMTGIPFNIIRKKSQQTPGEIKLKQTTGYSSTDLYLTLGRNKKVLIVDSVISTGGTINAVLEGLKELDAEIVDTVCVIERGGGVKNVRDTSGLTVKTLVNIDVKDGKVVFLK